MSRALRKDGTERFYQILGRYDTGENWSAGYLLHFMESIQPEPYGFHKSVRYGASGDVWQRTGHHGTYSREWANYLLSLARRREPIWKFKLVRTEVTQRTVVCA